MKQVRLCFGILLGILLLGNNLLHADNDNCTPLAYKSDNCRDCAIWEQPTCPCPTGTPIFFQRPIELSTVKIVPYGYVKWEGYWDTRQPVGSREDEAYFFPQPIRLDPRGIDINDHGKWQFTTIETRLGLVLTGPDWGCITTDGLIEADFRGPIEIEISTVRLRHAFGRVSWGTGSFLFGKWFHPLFILECFPHTIGFAIGAPMEPQARAPQLRLTQRWDQFELIFCLASERDFTSNGPIGVSTEYIRNAVIPNIHLQGRLYFGDHLIGIAGDYKRLTPRIESNTGYSVQEKVDSFIVEAFAAFRPAPWSLRLKAFWAENANSQLILSGFGVRTIDPVTDQRTYSPTSGAGAWLDFSYLFGCDDKELGLFVGGIKNLGSRDKLFIDPITKVPTIFSFTAVGQNIDYVVRVAPRFALKRDPIRFGAELDWTRASYGTPNECGRIRNGVPVDNFRILLVLMYLF